ncbi:pyridoxamine 5-phosphate oxidase [Candidatus Magnetobacterium bavaricum]|uniref:Pyridoxamine 5-phosphate oxidase n=1 Tax=Candidatus Magnetobacterium bavaricum TaxID=29290 RepID=A0A0F3GUP1_9BACT|nr:pyridoxamine 5-phosphate oxidase [Candidatus Magnetobacterium bavaricum]
MGKEQLKKLQGFINTRIANAVHFTGLFKDDERFIIQRPVGPDSVSSSFCFTMIVNPTSGVDRGRVLQRLREAEIEHRIITGGNFLRHDVIKYFDYEVTKSSNADIAHDYGFFVGNHPIDIRAEIDYLHKTLKDIAPTR